MCCCYEGDYVTNLLLSLRTTVVVELLTTFSQEFFQVVFVFEEFWETLTSVGFCIYFMCVQAHDALVSRGDACS